ncbi:hypothetical protein CDD83_11134 [Cordyceps sp. RAO-2017]|nr:hypothetical protein CDD83_11134 [Cordyceps sp. RAO-2017]
MDAGSARPRHFLEGKTIFVAGAGIAGCAWVVALRKLWDPALKPPTVVVFDRDPGDASLRRDGENYTISLSGHSEDGGLVTLQKLGLADSVFGCAAAGVGPDAGAFKIWGPDWRERLTPSRRPLHGLPTASIRIARSQLRRLLSDAVDAWNQSRVQWESQCVSAEKLDDGRVRVRIRRSKATGPAVGEGSGGLRGGEAEEEETQQDCDLLVAADGANSRLRALLRPDDGLQYAGAVLRGGLSRFDEGAVPSLPGRDWGFMLSGGGVSCFFSPVDDRTVFWAVGHPERDPAPELDRSGGARDEAAARAVVDRARQLGAFFREPFASMVARTVPRTVLCINAHDKKPFRHDDSRGRGPNDPAVVFIGDSNHALSPFAGIGANLALADGWDLAEQLCRRGGGEEGELPGWSLAKAVAAYDDISVPRAAKVLEGSRQMLRASHSVGWRSWAFWLVLVVRDWLS